MKTCLITGASGGVAAALAENLRADGWKLALVTRHADKLAPSNSEKIIPADVSSEEGAELAMREATDFFGTTPDAVINCAGAILIAPIARTSEAQYRACLSANLDTAFFTSKAYASALQNDGKIILAGYSWNDFALARYNGTTPLNTASQNINQMIVFTNQSTHTLTIQCSLPSASKIFIYNCLGQKVLQIQNELLMNLSFDISAFSKGVYSLKIENQSGSYSKKILIQ